jgi:hypothetical protein
VLIKDVSGMIVVRGWPSPEKPSGRANVQSI